MCSSDLLLVQLRSPPSDDEVAALARGLAAPTRIEADTLRFSLALDADVPGVVRTILDRANVADLRLEDPSLEELVAGFYEGPR